MNRLHTDPAIAHVEAPAPGWRARGWGARPWAAAPPGGLPLGWLPLLAVTSALGLLVVALANGQARLGAPEAMTHFWAGLALTFLPCAIRLACAGAGRRERVGLVMMLGLGLYLIKVFHSPVAFTFHDEFIHWRTALTIERSGHLFGENPLITVSPFYPGLQIVTSAIAGLGGLDIYGAGIIVLAVARLVLVLSLFLLVEEVSRSARVAGVATLVYISNPNFLFFTAQYGYESLALPVAVLTIFAVARRSRMEGDSRLIFNGFILIFLSTVVVSHHLTSYALVAFFVLWTVTPFTWRMARAFGSWYAGRGTLRELWPIWRGQLAQMWGEVTGASLTPSQMLPGETTLLSVVLSLSWLLYVATLVVGYLAPIFGQALSELLRLIAGELPGRQLFVDYSGQRPPAWEQAVALSSVLCILAALPLGLVYVWRNQRQQPLGLTLAVGALGYPAALALRLTQAGAETSNRSSEFLFLPIAFVLGSGAVYLWSARRWRALWLPLFSAWIGVVFLGGVIIGWPRWARLPEPYRVSADSRSIEAQGIAAATWAREHLRPGARVGADRINRLLMASYGEQRVVTNLSEGVNIAYVYFAPQIGELERQVLRQTRTTHLVVDRRLSRELPLAGVYFESTEPGSDRHRSPIDAAALAKFDGAPGVSRVYDGGEITIYDVGELWR